MPRADLYSPVFRRMWGDKKFCALSAPQPNARDLWIYLLTGPHTTPVPGLIPKGAGGLADDLGWDIEATKICLQEILDQGMAKLDRDRRLIWLPNAIKQNPPRAPKNVLGWAAAWRLLPECELLSEAAASIRTYLESKNQKMVDAFDRVVNGDSPTADLGECDEDHIDDDVSAMPRSTGSKPDFRSDPNRILDPIQTGSGMPSQEQEQEQDKSPTETSAAADAAAGPSQVITPAAVSQACDSTRADGTTAARSAPVLPEACPGGSSPPEAPPLAKSRNHQASKQRPPAAKTRDQCYREAYEAGIRDAAPGQAFALRPGKIQSLLGPVLGQHARDPDGPLRDAALDAWIRATAAEFRRAVAGDGVYWSGYEIVGFIKWLNTGRPRAQAPRGRHGAMIDDRPEKYGETREEFEARIERDRQRIITDEEQERAARLAAMTPEERACEEALPL